ncbi:YedE family putative selenium transporter [candidate division KSB1 bacterium]
MNTFDTFFSTRTAIIITGLTIGILASLLQYAGNPGNMGLCIACFIRDISGALGLHRAAAVQYIRPEIIGIILGSFIASLMSKSFRTRSGGNAVIRFVLGFFAMTGCLVFLGCSWRALLRLAGGDLNAVTGIAGFIAGIWTGVLFNKSGFSLGKSTETSGTGGLFIPAAALCFLLLLQFKPVLPSGAVFFSSTGPGSMNAPVFYSLTASMIIGILAQKTRFCTVGAFKNVIHLRDFHMFTGAAFFVLGAAVVNSITGQFSVGFTGQPVAHNGHLWNFGGMMLAGLAFTLGGGCPGRQLILAGQGNNDAAVFILGLTAGAAFAHNFNIAASPAGTSVWGMSAVIAGLAVCISIGLLFRNNKPN